MTTVQHAAALIRGAKLHWFLLCGIALATRLPGAWLLPSGEQDAYTYAETIARMHGQLRAGNFAFANLFDFWLPLYSFTGAVVNFAIGDALLTGKLLSAICGAACCVLVFSITRALTKNRALAWLAFALVTVSPLHVFYSAASMTDVPHACFVLAATRAAMARRWLLAAVAASVAEGLRVEAWLLVGLLPALQFLRERRVSLVAIFILLLPIVGSLAICWAETGDAFALFHRRTENVAAFLQAEPSRRTFHWVDMRRDFDYLMLGANALVFAGAFVACSVLLRRSRFDLRVNGAVFFSFFGFLVLAYATKAQPVIWIRYGLIFFALGTPLFFWSINEAMRGIPSRPWRALLFGLIVAFCARQSLRQIDAIAPALGDARAHRIIAAELRARYITDGDAPRSFSDDAAIRVLSGLGAARFLRTPLVPASSTRDARAFVDFLRADGIRYLVFMRMENSLPVRFFPELASGGIGTSFELLHREHSPFGPVLLLYRVR